MEALAVYMSPVPAATCASAAPAQANAPQAAMPGQLRVLEDKENGKKCRMSVLMATIFRAFAVVGA